MTVAPNKSAKKLLTQQSVNTVVKSICDIMRRSNCAGALQYVPELTWILFLRILDEREEREQQEAEAVDSHFQPSLAYPCRWQDWASPGGAKRKELETGKLNAVKAFVDTELLPHLKDLKNHSSASPKQKVISEVMSGVERTRIDTDKNFLEVLDKVQDISQGDVDPTHVFALSQVYEGLLLKMGEKGNDGGQFFTPREVIRAMVRVVAPEIGQTVYDPCAGTGGFLAQACEYLTKQIGTDATPAQLDTLTHHTFYGREKEDLVYPITLANLILHGINEPHIWHGNTLTNAVTYEGLFTDAAPQFDVILTNPPFGGKEGKEAQTHFAYKTGATQILFLQHVLSTLKTGGRCGIVLDEGVSFKTSEIAYVQTKRLLLDSCNLYCILSLPQGVFTAAGAGVKTNLLFFQKGSPTEKIWYYDLSRLKVGKTTPLTLDKFEDFFQLLPERADSTHSWTVDIVARRAEAKQKAEPFHAQARVCDAEVLRLRAQARPLRNLPSQHDQFVQLMEQATQQEVQARELKSKAEAIENAAFDLKAVNPNVKETAEQSSPTDLLSFIAAKGREMDAALARLQSTLPVAL